MKRFVYLTLILLMTACGAQSDEVVANPDEALVGDADVTFSEDTTAYTLQVLHAADQEASPDVIENAPNFSAIVNGFRDDAGNTLVLGSGDLIIPGAFFFATGGQADVRIANAVGFQAMALGNHEFDLGTNALAGLIAQEVEDDGTLTYAGTQFPYLSANLDFSANEDLNGFVVPAAQAPEPNSVTDSVVFEVGGERVGVVGATTPQLPSISSPGTVQVLPAQPDNLEALADIIQAEVDALAGQGINKVILLAHLQQIQNEIDLAGLLQSVDIIISGGSDTLLADEDDRVREEYGKEPQGPYPLLYTSAAGEPVALVNTDREYRYVGRLLTEFDADGVLTGIGEASGPVPADDAGAAEFGTEPAPGVVEAVNEVETTLVELDGTLYGATEVFLNGIREAVRTQETNLGNLTADANLAAARTQNDSVTLSLKNGGGIRASIGDILPGDEGERVPPQENPLIEDDQDGDISQLDIQNSLRFNNTLVTLTVTAEELKRLLEHGVAATEPGATPGQFPQVGGFAFSFDPSQQALQYNEAGELVQEGERVQSLVVFDAEGNVADTVVEGGTLQGDPARTFDLITLNFLAELRENGLGGDGYPFPAGERSELTDEAGEPLGEQEALQSYLEANFPRENPYSQADTPIEEDTRIQNLSFREDTVGEGADGETGGGNGGADGFREVPIYEIQGTGHVSPFESETIVTTGIVTATSENGFYLQDARGDGDDATSDALFVFTGDEPRSEPTVSVGDEVEVRGPVSEFVPGGADTGNLSTTQIFRPGYEVLSWDNALPTPVLLVQGGRTPPTQAIDDDLTEQYELNAGEGDYQPAEDGVDFYESLEAMRVTVEGAQAVGPTTRFGEIFTVLGASGATGLSERGTLNISPDDFNPERIQIDEDASILDFDFPQVDVNARLTDVVGVVGYSFGNFEVYPTESFEVKTASSLEPEVSDIESGEGQLSVASYNVLNLDPNGDDGDADVAGGQFDAVAVDIADNLNAPDIVALQEIQDNDGSVPPGDSDVSAADVTLQTLVDAILAAGGPEYAFIDNPFIGDDTSGGQPGGNIRAAFLYNPERVSLAGEPQPDSFDSGAVQTVLDPQDQQTNPENPFFDSRLPLVATFAFNGREVTVISNHFSSKGGSKPLLGSTQRTVVEMAEPGEGQEDPEINGSLDERRDQAQAVKDYADDLLAENADANVVAAGDFNEFEFISPLETLEMSLVNLTETLEPDERYSYIFQGNSQSLDHILVSESLAVNAQFDAVHLNSEFADQASDHDPLLASFALAASDSEPSGALRLERLATYTTGAFDEGAAEIVAYDPGSQRLFIVNSNAVTLDILDISDPANPMPEEPLDMTQYGAAANSVDVFEGTAVVAVENEIATEPGTVVFLTSDGELISQVTVGALPDMLTFTPDGSKVVVANEGEPSDDYSTDPEGSVSIIDMSGGTENLTQEDVTEVGFSSFNDAELDESVRVFGPEASVAQDLEPEYIAVSPDSTLAWVALQENNALARLDLEAGEVTDLIGLGFKDHSLEENAVDPTDEDGGINIGTHPVFGMYQPDAIATFEANGETYIVTANEGDVRDYDGYSEEARLGDDEYMLAEDAFPNADELKETLGRLTVTTATGDTDGDGAFEEIYTFGGRSFSIHDAAGELVFDSGDALERLTAEAYPEFFNANNDENGAETFESRSDNKGPEPEGVVTGQVGESVYAFIGLERIGGVVTYDVSDPENPQFVDYTNYRDFSADIKSEAAGDLGPEGLLFISAEESPTGTPLLVVGNEVSGSTSIYALKQE